jgi:hypothetical protein
MRQGSRGNTHLASADAPPGTCFYGDDVGLTLG